MDINALAGDGMLGRLARTIRSIVRGLAAAVREEIDHRRTSQELASLDGRDLDRVLTDIGCNRQELADLIRRSAAPRLLLDQMILRLGLERPFMFLEPGMVRELELRCGTCRARRRCARWLRDGRDRDGYRRFCPNAGNFDVLAAQH
ncbi:MAG TPA: DUF6455 family protein [Alphaproteobacteria bacterium]